MPVHKWMIRQASCVLSISEEWYTKGIFNTDTSYIKIQLQLMPIKYTRSHWSCSQNICKKYTNSMILFFETASREEEGIRLRSLNHLKTKSVLLSSGKNRS